MKEYESNKGDVDYLQKLKEKAEDARIQERFELSHSSQKKGLFLSRKLQSHSESANFLKTQISDMNRASTEIKNKPLLYSMNKEEDQRNFYENDQEEKEKEFSKEIATLPFMMNEVQAVPNTMEDGVYDNVDQPDGDLELQSGA
eukprot:CAMPEP_0116893172 /NCGR_PEP_ID=MMETSP0467-20121206/3227_1 /TAXON_ID=283647 /ORGANISM="Mesodinium pulex, Strain SPMC105" /LENGTH=143 /DNA_ID=CAMNT_0004562699 /DNA_START=833 /DNA_END=1264 /DNA_ORIENTATION=+